MQTPIETFIYHPVFILSSILIAAGFIYALYSIFKKKKIFISIGMIILGIIMMIYLFYAQASALDKRQQELNDNWNHEAPRLNITGQ